MHWLSCAVTADSETQDASWTLGGLVILLLSTKVKQDFNCLLCDDRPHTTYVFLKDHQPEHLDCYHPNFNSFFYLITQTIKSKTILRKELKSCCCVLYCICVTPSGLSSISWIGPVPCSFFCLKFNSSTKI